jgi:acetoin utilization deacetylase AcuC-like enzyme
MSVVFDEGSMTPPVITSVYYSSAFVAAEYPFDTTRKSAWIAKSLGDQPIPGVQLVEPVPLGEAELQMVHSSEYVRAVRCGQPQALAASSGIPWDPEVWRAVCASNGGAVAAARLAFQTRRHTGSLSSGLHHATARCGRGYCTFNGLALAARSVHDLGAQSVLIVDLDAHCGGGTYSIVKSWPYVVHLDIACSSFDTYSVDQSGRSTLDEVQCVDAYLSTLDARLNALDGPFDLVLYNAGVDPHQACEIGGMRGVTFSFLAERERLVFEWARIHETPVAFVLAGGYSGSAFLPEDLVRQHRLTIAAAALSNAAHTLEKAAIQGLAHGGPHPETERTRYDALGRTTDCGPLGDEGLGVTGIARTEIGHQRPLSIEHD